MKARPITIKRKEITAKSMPEPNTEPSMYQNAGATVSSPVLSMTLSEQAFASPISESLPVSRRRMGPASLLASSRLPARRAASVFPAAFMVPLTSMMRIRMR